MKNLEPLTKAELLAIQGGGDLDSLFYDAVWVVVSGVRYLYDHPPKRVSPSQGGVATWADK